MRKKTKYVVIFILAVMFYTYAFTQAAADIDCNLTRLIYCLFTQAFFAIYFFPTLKKKKAK